MPIPLRLTTPGHDSCGYRTISADTCAPGARPARDAGVITRARGPSRPGDSHGHRSHLGGARCQWSELWVPYYGAPMGFPARVGVVIPAHNEQDLLPACLAAVLTAARGVTLPVDVVVVLDACTDNSARTAAAFSRPDLPGVTLTTMSVSHRSVGAARRDGAAELLREHHDASMWLATTDADSTVPEQWLYAQLQHARAGATVVAGTVAVADWGEHPAAVRCRAERDYTAAGAHRHIHGANLSFTAAAYLRAGGFPSRPFDEDVGLLRAFLDNGETVVWAQDLAVITSARRTARAPYGFSSYLRGLHPDLAPVHEDRGLTVW